MSGILDDTFVDPHEDCAAEMSNVCDENDKLRAALAEKERENTALRDQLTRQQASVQSAHDAAEALISQRDGYAAQLAALLASRDEAVRLLEVLMDRRHSPYDHDAARAFITALEKP